MRNFNDLEDNFKRSAFTFELDIASNNSKFIEIFRNGSKEEMERLLEMRKNITCESIERLNTSNIFITLRVAIISEQIDKDIKNRKEEETVQAENNSVISNTKKKNNNRKKNKKKW